METPTPLSIIDKTRQVEGGNSTVNQLDPKDIYQTLHLTTAEYMFSFLFLKRFYLFIHERHRLRERGRDTGRGRSRPHAGSLMQDSIPGLQDHTLGQRRR